MCRLHTPVMGKEASLLGVLARAEALAVASSPSLGFDVEEGLSMAVDNGHARKEHPRHGSSPARRVTCGPAELSGKQDGKETGKLCLCLCLCLCLSLASARSLRKR